MYNKLSNLNEDCILIPVDLFIENGKYLNTIMENIDGITIDAFMQTKVKKRLSETEAKIIIKKLQEVFLSCHNKHIYHDNINVSNIYVNSNECKILKV